MHRSFARGASRERLRRRDAFFSFSFFLLPQGEETVQATTLTFTRVLSAKVYSNHGRERRAIL